MSIYIIQNIFLLIGNIQTFDIYDCLTHLLTSFMVKTHVVINKKIKNKDIKIISLKAWILTFVFWFDVFT